MADETKNNKKRRFASFKVVPHLKSFPDAGACAWFPIDSTIMALGSSVLAANQVSADFSASDDAIALKFLSFQMQVLEADRGVNVVATMRWSVKVVIYFLPFFVFMISVE